MDFYSLAKLVHDNVEKRYQIILGARGAGKTAFFEAYAKLHLLERLVTAINTRLTAVSGNNIKG